MRRGRKDDVERVQEQRSQDEEGSIGWKVCAEQGMHAKHKLIM